MPTMNMTQQWVERIKPPASGRDEWFDAQVKGLGLRVSESGKKSWFIHYRVKGDRTKRRLTLDVGPSASLADVRKEARARLLAAAEGRNHGAEKQALKEAPTFKELAEEYLTKYASDLRSFREQQRVVRKELIPRWGSRKANDITSRDIIQLLDEMKDRGAPILANRTRALINVMFKWSIPRKFVDSNPCSGVDAVAQENQRDRVLTEDELKAVWAAFAQLTPLMGDIFRLRLLTAQRGGEVESIRWSDVDLKTGWWTIPKEVAKNDKSHRVPLSKPALGILQALRDKSDGSQWVFPSPKVEGQHIANIQKAAERVKEITGINFVPHDLRRTAASLMTGMRIPRLVVSKILNHAESGVTYIYDRHSYDDEKREALDLWAQRLTEIVSASPRPDTKET